MAASERLLVNKYISCMAASCFLALALGTAALPPRGAHSWSRVLMLALSFKFGGVAASTPGLVSHTVFGWLQLD
jgi:hypothetical protein